MKQRITRIITALTIATLAATGTLIATNLEPATPTDTGWGAPTTTIPADTGWGTPPDSTGPGTATTYDTGWG